MSVQELKEVASDVLTWNRTRMTQMLSETTAHFSQLVDSEHLSTHETLERICVHLEERLGEETWLKMYRRYKDDLNRPIEIAGQDQYKYNQCVQAWRLVRCFRDYEIANCS